MGTNAEGRALTRAERQMVEDFRCPGCMLGGPRVCDRFKREQYGAGGMGCSAHVPGTTMMPGGKIALGLPRGFCKTGEGSMTIRLWPRGSAPSWDRLNVAVWAMETDGHLFVRTFSPRLNRGSVDVVAGGTLALVPGALDVGAFITEID